MVETILDAARDATTEQRQDQFDILVIGGAYAGLWAVANAVDRARSEGRAVRVGLVADSDHLEHRPRLYEQSPEGYRTPLRPLLEVLEVNFVHGRADDIDTSARTVAVVVDGETVRLRYGKLLLASGGRLRPLPLPGAQEYSWNIDTLSAASAFDKHLRTTVQEGGDAASRTYVVVGAGMCGLELATELRDRIAVHSDAETGEAARIILVEQATVVGPQFGDSPRPVIEQALELARVELRLGTSLTAVTADSVTLSSGENIPTRSVIITVGMQASELADKIDGVHDQMGRLHVDEFLRVKGQDDVFAAGDIAHALVDGDQVSIMSCQDAKTMGKYAGRNVTADWLGVSEMNSYQQADYTTCLDLGRFGAVYTEGFERELKSYGAEAKKRKLWLNNEYIYPPPADNVEDVLAALRIDSRGR